MHECVSGRLCGAQGGDAYAISHYLDAKRKSNQGEPQGGAQDSTKRMMTRMQMETGAERKGDIQNRATHNRCRQGGGSCLDNEAALHVV